MVWSTLETYHLPLPTLLTARLHPIPDRNQPGTQPQIYLQMNISRDFHNFLYLTILPSLLSLMLTLLSWIINSSHKIHFHYLLALLMAVWHATVRCSLNLVAPTMLDLWVAICSILILLPSLHSPTQDTRVSPRTQSHEARVGAITELPTTMYGGLQEEDSPAKPGKKRRPWCVVVVGWTVIGAGALIAWCFVTLQWSVRDQLVTLLAGN